MRSLLGYTSASRSQNSKAAFEDATKFMVANMLQSMHKRLEVECLYGQSGLATVASVAGLVITVPAADWAPGIFAGGENMPIEIRSSVGVLRGTANLTNVNLDTRELTVDVMPGGVVATDVIYYSGAYGKEFAGIHKIVSNTGSLFGIDAAAYSLWKGNTVSVSGDLSLEKLEIAINRAIEKGLDNDVKCLLNPKIFAVLVADEAALRQYDNSYDGKRGENGFSSLKFHAANGVIEVESSIHVKQGHAFLLNMRDFIRIGSSDISFKRPGAEGDFFRDSENATAYELRVWTDQAIFTHSPGKNVLVTGFNIPA